MNNNKLKLTLLKSKYGRTKNHGKCIQGLGLRKIRHSVVVDNTPESLGMINKVRYLLKVEEV